MNKGILWSAMPMAEEQLHEYERQLSEQLGQEISLECKCDPSLIGGVALELFGRVYDGSLKGQLRQLRAALSRE